MPRLETVTIVADNKKGRKIINKSDFDPEKHKLFKGEVEEVKEPTEEVKETETDPNAAYSKKESSRGWFDVFDKEGNKVNDKSLREKEADELIETLK